MIWRGEQNFFLDFRLKGAMEKSISMTITQRTPANEYLRQYSGYKNTKNSM